MSAAPVDQQAKAEPRPAVPVVPPPTPSPFVQTVDPAAYTEDAPPFPPAVLEALAVEPDKDSVEERDVKEGSSVKLLYVPWVHYQRVLIAAFGRGGFRLVPRGPERVQGNVMTWKFALFVRVPGQQRFHFVDESVGECNLQGGRMSPANAAEGAKSDALVKCCKRLGIFDQLWDPNWRRAWERHHQAAKRGQVRSAPWPVGEGGGAPHAAAADSSSPASGLIAGEAPSPTTCAPVASAKGQRMENVVGDEAKTPDVGEPATDEQKAALTAEVKRLEWKVGYLKLWIAETFGFQVTDVRRVWEAFSQRNADAAYALLTYHGKPNYPQVLARLRAEGSLS